MQKINQGNVRIIGGKYRGKKLRFLEVEGLRPTPDRVRETLFNWLMHDIREARCLDAFAGSGALGMEAYSRGASQVLFVEAERRVFDQLQTVVAEFQAPQLTVMRASVIDYLKAKNTHLQRPFDIVFVDPPFAHPQLFDCITLLAQSPLLVDQGLLYVEAPHDLHLDPECWEPLKMKHAGQVCYGLYRKRSGLSLQT